VNRQFVAFRRISSYDYPERKQPNRTGPAFLLSDVEVDDIIEYVSESCEHIIIEYDVLHRSLGLNALSKH
jgi:hypothetical protein